MHTPTTPWPAVLAPFVPSFPPVPISIQRVSAPTDSDSQTADTVGKMSAVVAQSVHHPLVQRAAREALAYARTPEEKAASIFAWVKGHVRFRNDPQQDELLIEPPLLLSMSAPAGDCDDFSMLTASLLQIAGVPWEFVTVAADPSDPSRFSHIYLRAAVQNPINPVGNEGTAMDTSHGQFVGWEAQDHGPVFRKLNWPRPAGAVLHGLGDTYDYGGEYGAPVGVPDVAVSAPGFNWSSVIPGIFSTAEKAILNTVGAPAAGTYVQTGPSGTVYSRSAPGLSINPPFGITTASGGVSTWVLLGGAAIVLLLVLKGGHGR